MHPQEEYGKANAEKAIEEIRTKNTQEVQEERNRLLASLENTITEREKCLEQLTEKYNFSLDKLEIVDDIHELKEEVKFLERRERELENAVKAQEAKLKSPDLPKELTEIKTILDLLQGRSYDKEAKKVKYQPQLMVAADPENGVQIIQSMVEKFDQNGRPFSFEEMANLRSRCSSHSSRSLRDCPVLAKHRRLSGLSKCITCKQTTTKMIIS